VIPTEQIAKSVSTSKAGFFATLRGLLHLQGASAPSEPNKGMDLMNTRNPTAATPGARLKTLLAGMAIALACALAIPVAAQAAEPHPPFSIKPGSFHVTTSSDQAGAHADLTTSFAFSEDAAGGVGALPRNAEVVYPLGITGYPANIKTCDPVQLQLEICPSDAQVGTLELAFRVFPGNTTRFLLPLFNMVPPPNEAAVFGFQLINYASGDIVLSVGPEYRVHARASNIFTGYELLSQSLTVWGVPADPSHNAQRGLNCEYRQNGEENCSGHGGLASNENAVPYLVNPTQCTGAPVQAEVVGLESWQGEKAPVATTDMGPFTGCESLKFAPTISFAPEETSPTAPSGYEGNLKVPQTEGAESLGTADLKDTVIKLPEGVVLSPSAANGLQSCSEAQIGMIEGKANAEPAACPAASKLAALSVITPALKEELKGTLFLGGPPAGPITHPPFTVYLTLEGHGILVKIRGSASANPVTGQVTTVFDENPEDPFSQLKIDLTGGSRATFANPSACGPYHAETDLTPWTTPFGADATPSSSPFEITGCQGARFSPSFAASSLSNQAGGYSTLRVTGTREDSDEDLGGLAVTTPPGLSGNLSKVPLCQEPQASQGTCGPASQIGEVTAGAGPGPEPYFIKGGRVYVTGPYGGAPFGLTVDVSEKAGPFDLGSGPCDCEVVRASVNIDPHTAQITVDNPTLPQGKYGIPFQVKSINVDINRPEFVFNPTSCDPLSVTGTLSSTQGIATPVSSHFQATNCAALKFQPKFAVSTQGKTSRANGASLTAKLTYPNTPQGTQANIASVKVELPKRLPSRLTTLQKACTAAQFEANPAGCPVASIIGRARAITPILPVPLEGPAYFVSHGGEAFPSLEVVLQGDNVTVDLVGTTFISKSGITSSTFKTVPDVPVGSFELVLPEGKYSALAANGNLCTSKLVMPTAFVAQNGAEIHESTKIGVTGCPPTRPKVKAVKHKQKKAKAKKASADRRASR